VANDSGVSVFVFSEDSGDTKSQKFPSRHSKMASQAIARQHCLVPNKTFMLRQHPQAIDAGVFHNDVIATSNMNLLIHHEYAFKDAENELDRLERTFQRINGQSLNRLIVSNSQLPLAQAVASYLFNSQIVIPAKGHKNGEESGMIIFCPHQCREIELARSLIESWVNDPQNPIERVEYVTLAQSMAGGGGPACLRLRVSLDDEQIREIPKPFWLTPERIDWLRSWIIQYYPRELTMSDLARKEFAQHALHAVDVLYREMNLSIRLTDLTRFKSV
jgi:succinylarginine dihydrolase